MLHDISASSEILQAYRSFPLSGFHPLTVDMRKVLEEADKPKKGGKNKGTKTVLEVPNQTEVRNEEDVSFQPKVSEMATTIPEVSTTIPTLVPIHEDFFQSSFVPSPTDTTSTPITIASCPPVSLGVSQV
ncbi:unnamed protein product [Lactuca saligna]|uniref:Uncharacterized protein n=1 Tax=Lactuca saligna TaxID=75948 RepID=A0AA35YDD7_LACSI|nr:unnamed protein product [Lactuca saligna]